MGNARIVDNALDHFYRGDLMSVDLDPLREAVVVYNNPYRSDLSQLFRYLVRAMEDFVKEPNKLNAQLLERARKDAYPW